MKVVTIVGARPQFIKASAVSKVFKDSGLVEEIIIHTGQHFDEQMSAVFFAELDIPPPHITLNINRLSHGAMTGQMMEGIEKVLLTERPDWVLVYGDTNSTLAGALAAKKLKIKVAHVEAGLRSFNLDMPEEINRILTDRVSDLLFCPTSAAVDNLMKEGFLNFGSKVIKVGDVMKDVSVFYAAKAVKPKVELPERFILCTIHRAANVDDSRTLEGIMKSIVSISKEIPIVCPTHPRLKLALHNEGISTSESRIHFIPPASYLEMVYLLQHCELVITDSGGLQKEAYFFHKKCLVIRDETEWVELLQPGRCVLSGTNPENIKSCYRDMISSTNACFEDGLYGQGEAAEQILCEILKY